MVRQVHEYTLGEAAAYLHVSPQTVRNYEKTGKLACHRTPRGHRRFTQEQLDAFLGKKPQAIYAFYARSSSGSDEAISNQLAKLEAVFGPSIFVYRDKASGLSEQRPGLWRMRKDAKAGKFTHIAVTNPDRLTRFGYRYLEELFGEYGVTLEATEEHKDKNAYDELMQDFMSLIASFSGKFYKLRSTEARRRLLSQAQKTLEEAASETHE